MNADGSGLFDTIRRNIQTKMSDRRYAALHIPQETEQRVDQTGYTLQNTIARILIAEDAEPILQNSLGFSEDCVNRLMIASTSLWLHHTDRLEQVYELKGESYMVGDTPIRKVNRGIILQDRSRVFFSTYYDVSLESPLGTEVNVYTDQYDESMLLFAIAAPNGRLIDQSDVNQLAIIEPLLRLFYNAALQENHPAGSVRSLYHGDGLQQMVHTSNGRTNKLNYSRVNPTFLSTEVAVYGLRCNSIKEFRT